jgi:DNA-binding NtrC family response regulator
MSERAPATIVVLGNHSASLELIEQTLRESGDRILATSDPSEAFELVRRVRIDLLIGETALLEGREQPLASELHSIQRDLRILSLGGQQEAKAAAGDGEMTLRVPFSLDELWEAVETALALRA